MNRCYCRRLLLSLLFCISASSSAQAQSITPSDVFAQVSSLSDDVERLRFHMGAAKIAPLDLNIRNAQPHDVYFLALKLFQKSGRLLFQITRKSTSVPTTSSEVYLPSDVSKLISAARQNIALVIQFHGLPETTSAAAKLDESKQPSDVFISILALNRQINALLDRRFAPSDVFEEITLAIGYCSLLLREYPDVRRIPDEQPVPPGRVPSDVFFRLLDSLKQVKALYALEGLESLDVDASRVSPEKITPSDVFDIGSLVVSRLDYLHKHKSIEIRPREPYYPGRVYPTDVYRLVGVMQSQLALLLEQY